MNLHNIEQELNKMRAETLGEAGKKLEALNEMIRDERHYQERMIKICNRIEKILQAGCKRKKKRQFERLLIKMQTKMDRSLSYLNHMEKKKQELYSNVIMQREALGLTDHRWIDEFYMKDEK